MLSTQNKTRNRSIQLASRPIGEPKAENFRLEESSLPKMASGEILLRTIYLSLDPYMRGRMSDEKSYASPVALGDVMVGGTVCRVMQSNHPAFKEGEWVLSYSGWQDYAVSDGKALLNLGHTPPNPSYALGILGMPAFTAYMGLLDIGKPKAGETIVVGAATGPVGSTVGQLGKIKDCRVVGIAGGRTKCDYAINTLGFDACIDHHAPDFAQQLQAACPDGIDIYFENVGGKVLDAVLPLLNMSARMPVCGLISHYNQVELPSGKDRLSYLMGMILKKRMTVKGFIIFDDYAPHFPEFRQQMELWLQEGKVKYKEQIIQGLENTPQAFIGLLKGENFGKLVIQVGEKELI
ncbi:MAG: NADP-dependent oxidoreductase [Saezia sp.]